MTLIRIGLDDTDSPDGMCTTYLCALLAEELQAQGFVIRDRLLIRLNPNAPFKTRGNAALCLLAERSGSNNDSVHSTSAAMQDAFETACSLVEKYAEFDCEKTNPGVVVTDKIIAPEFFRKALTDFCTIEEAEEILEKSGALYRGWKVKRGLIGALSAVSAELSDYTYELLAYRDVNDHAVRSADRESIFLSEREFYPHTWDTADLTNGVVVCVPHTPDPVLFGIRGESPEWVKKARDVIISQTPVREVIYRTNQGTDMHLIDAKICEIQEGRSYRLRGVVSSKPETLEGGHVRFSLRDCDTSAASAQVRCMAYEPTKNFRDEIRALVCGDVITVCGSYKNESINMEKFFVERLAEDLQFRAPVCTCGKRMTSAGKGQGYKCRKCGAKSDEPEKVVHPRMIEAGWHEVPPTARRHLSMPLARWKDKRLYK